MKKQKMGKNYLVDTTEGTITVLSVVCAGLISQHASDTKASARNAGRRAALLAKVTKIYGFIPLYGWEIVEGY